MITPADLGLQAGCNTLNHFVKYCCSFFVFRIFCCVFVAFGVRIRSSRVTVQSDWTLEYFFWKPSQSYTAKRSELIERLTVENHSHGLLDISWLVVSNMFNFPFHIWDVILPIDFHSIIFQDGYCTTNQFRQHCLRHSFGEFPAAKNFNGRPDLRVSTKV